MGLSTTAAGKLLAEINCAVESQAAIIVDIDVQSLEISWRIDDANLSSLHEVVGNNHMLLIRSHLDVVRADGRLILIRVIEALHVVQVANVESGNVVGSCQSEVDEAAVLTDIGAVGGAGISLWQYNVNFANTY